MPSIANLRFELVEKEGAAAALVSYTIRGHVLDVQLRVAFRESVVLMGDDLGPGEDLGSRPLRNGLVFSAPITFRSTRPIPRHHLVALPAKDLDEDPAPLFEEDEIRASVSLANNSLEVTKLSNIIRRGGPVFI